MRRHTCVLAHCRTFMSRHAQLFARRNYTIKKYIDLIHAYIQYIHKDTQFVQTKVDGHRYALDTSYLVSKKTAFLARLSRKNSRQAGPRN